MGPGSGAAAADRDAASSTDFRPWRFVLTRPLNFRRHALSLRASVVLPLVLALGCGHSEDEWQAQLAKYAQLQKKDADLSTELAAQQAKVKELSEQLEGMGVKLSSE